MARNLYGATSADFTLTSGGRVVPGSVLTIWSARTGGTQITDLTDVGGTAITSVTSGADGSVVYYGPDADKDTHWAQASQGSRIAIRPVNITGETGATPALTVGTVGTGTAAASLTGTSEAPVLNLVLPSAGANGVNTAAIQDGAVTAAKIGALTTKGDLLARDGSGAVRLPVGTDGQVLVADAAASAGVKWGAEPAVKATVGNLLTDNQASPATMGAYPNEWAATEISYGLYQAYGGGTASIWADVPIGPTGGETFTLYGMVETVGTASAVALQFVDAGGAILSSHISQAVPAGQTGHSEITAVAPVGTTVVRCFAVYADAAAQGDRVWVKACGLWRGAGGQWAMPGTPIVGQSSIASNGAVHLSGTGAPESVVTAAPGSTWLQTDASNDVKGWIRWIKASGTGSTGWVAGPEADTGWRNVSASAANGWTASQLLIRRQGSRVDIVGAANGGAASADDIYPIPTGFRTPSGVRFWGAAAEGGTISKPVEANGNNANLRSSSRSGSLFLTVAYQTPDAWPTSLPGSAA